MTKVQIKWTSDVLRNVTGHFLHGKRTALTEHFFLLLQTKLFAKRLSFTRHTCEAPACPPRATGAQRPTCGQEQPGIEQPTLSLMDNLLYFLFACLNTFVYYVTGTMSYSYNNTHNTKGLIDIGLIITD